MMSHDDALEWHRTNRYQFEKMWAEFTQKHNLWNNAQFEELTFLKPLICSEGKPCIKCLKKA